VEQLELAAQLCWRFITQGCNVAVNHLSLLKDDVHRHNLIE
jgi:hypothetical protein